jgi:type I restriction enzyme S subunit
MIADLKPYPEYRSAEGRWLGEIPSHWMVRRMKYVVREMDSRSTSGKEQLLRISQYTGVTQRRRADSIEEPDTRADSLVDYKRVEPNDLVINIMLAWNGSMGVSKYSGIASPAYCVYRFGSDVHPWYFHNLLRTPAYKARIKASSTGVVESRLRLYSDDLGRIEAMIPPAAEQAAIARFLDWANGRLERAIRAKRKVIALLNEQKQAIIHRAVTRGLDPSVPLKPSGIPWLGDIPQHWEVRPLKQLLVRMDYGTSQHVRGEGKVRVLTMGHIRDGKVILPEKGGLDAVPPGLVLEKNDLLFNRTNSPELVGKVGLFAGDADEEITFASYLVRLRIRLEQNPLWLNYLLNSTVFWSYARSQALVSLHQANLNSRRYGQMVLPVPSRRAEQDKIVDYIQSQADEIESAIFRLEREIDLLREYHTRLVADVVTGKLDVREVAARLPDEAPPDTAEEEIGLSDETQAYKEDAAV